MDRDHSSLIIILVGGILFVLGGILFVQLVGRDTAISVGRDVAIPVIGGALGVALVVGTLALFIGYIRRKRREGQPWLFHFILWPAYIGVLAVLGLAALHSSDNACGGPYECVGRIPLYWLPASLVLLSALLWRVEDFIIERRKSRLPAASTGMQRGMRVPRNLDLSVMRLRTIQTASGAILRSTFAPRWIGLSGSYQISNPLFQHVMKKIVPTMVTRLIT